LNGIPLTQRVQGSEVYLGKESSLFWCAKKL
jgi:hypothetical protein